MHLNFPQRMFKVAGKTRWLIMLMVILIVEIFPQQGMSRIQIYVLIIVAAIYNIAIRFIPWQKQWQDGKGYRICYAESTLDIVFISCIIYLTGGLKSDFFLFYFIVIIFAAIYYNLMRCFFVTTCISLLYILIGILTSPTYSCLLPIFMGRLPLLFVIAGFISYLTQELKVQSEELAMEKEKLQALLATMKVNLKEIEEKSKVLHELYNVSLKIGSTLGLEEQLSIIADVAGNFLKADLTTISLVDEKGIELKTCMSKGKFSGGILTRDRMKIEDSLLGNVIKTGEVLSIDDLHKIGVYSSGQEMSSLLALPLKIENNTIGVFSCAYVKHKKFNKDDVNFLELISSRAALAINNAKLHEEIRKLAITDGLTGLYNYRYFYENLRNEIERCKRLNYGGLSLLFIDIDHFKQFNDLYGHQKGDMVLERVGMILSIHTRKTDVAARYGGEEFVIIAPGTPKENSLLLGERIRSAVSEKLFSHEEKTQNNITFPVTVSIGTATFPNDAGNQEELIKCADNALYNAKNTGRDRVVGWTSQ
ncbi:sensor domain-containing diguanylate cyclase [Candidatus Desantisbacteria bacterium]|nr:sensor domain-containing diguanylate cyclase [Candidatus Desantisbacteria bacterium]